MQTSWQPGSSWCVCVPVVRVCMSSVCLCLSQRFVVLFAWLCVCRVYLQFQQEVMGISDIWKFDLSEGCPLDIEVTAFSAYTGSWKARTGTQVFYLIIQVLPYPNLSLIHYAAWFGESGRWYAGIRGGPRFASYGGSRGGVGGYLEGGGYVSLAQTPPGHGSVGMNYRPLISYGKKSSIFPMGRNP